MKWKKNTVGNEEHPVNRKRLGVKWKIFACFIGFTAFLLVLLWLFQIIYLNSFYKELKKRDLYQAADQLLDHLGNEDFAATVNELANKYDIGINITNSTGETIYASFLQTNSHIFFKNTEEFQNMYDRAKDSGGQLTLLVEGQYKRNGDAQFLEDENFNKAEFDRDAFWRGDTEIPTEEGDLREGDPMMLPGQTQMLMNMNANVDAESLVYIHVITDMAGDEYVIFMTSLITPVDATVNTLRVQFIYITIIFIILAGSIAFIIAKWIARPIVTVNEAAKELAEGNYDVEFKGKGYREVDELSVTLNNTAKELGRTEGLRRELIANVSHDLRTPLTMITAYSEIMRDIPGENSPENVQVIIDEANRLAGLVNDMLDLSKLQAGVMELNLTEYSLTDGIISVMKRYQKLTEQKGYHISFEYRENVNVKADEHKIYQVVYNLVNNAINYIGEDETVIVRQVVKGDIVRIEVEDHGEGIDEENLKYIWDRYYKVDKTHKRAVSGTGLGLSIVCNILKLHDARFGVESKKGSGSIFWFELKKAGQKII